MLGSHSSNQATSPAHPLFLLNEPHILRYHCNPRNHNTILSIFHPSQCPLNTAISHLNLGIDGQLMQCQCYCFNNSGHVLLRKPGSSARFVCILIILKSHKEVVISGLLNVDALDVIQVEANFETFVRFLLFIFVEGLVCSLPVSTNFQIHTFSLLSLPPVSLRECRNFQQIKLLQLINT